MKSQTSGREAAVRHSSREDHRKPSSQMVNNLIKKITNSIPMGVPTKSLMLHSHRGSKPKVDSIKIPAQQSAHHSRYYKTKAENIVCTATWECRAVAAMQNIINSYTLRIHMSERRRSTTGATQPLARNLTKIWKTVSKLTWASSSLDKNYKTKSNWPADKSTDSTLTVNMS